MSLVRKLMLVAATVIGLQAQAQSDISVDLLAGNIAVAEIDSLIAENAANPAVAFDLLGLKADAQINAGDPRAAAETMLVMVALQSRFPDVIDADLPALILDAADLLLDAGEVSAALDQLYAAVEALRERAANPDLLGAVLLRIAELEDAQGRSDVADQIRASADDLAGPLDAPPATRASDPGFVNIDVFYATDRKPSGKTRPARFFGYDRDDHLNYGIASVTIPRTHQPGTLAAPSVWKLEFAQDPTKHVMLQSVNPVPADAFFAGLRGALQDQSATDAFVFVHGYNVSFDKAAKRTAQLAYDMNFRGAPILYSWPSRGATIGYIPDTAVVRLSGRRLTLFLEDVVAKSGATTIHIIAHSMGNRAVTDALELMASRHQPVTEPVFDQIIFAAPDVDQGLFNAMIPTIRPLARRLTLYASEEDWALEASRKLHGSAPRAGQGGDDVLSSPDIDTIDMTGLGQDMLAHSYVSNDQSAILDISTLFWLNSDPEDRCGLVDRAERAGVWDHQGQTCADQSLLNIVSSLRNAHAYSRDEVRDVLDKTFKGAPEAKSYEGFLLSLTQD